MSGEVLLDRRGEIAVLTLNRPEQLNALNYATVDAIVSELDELDADHTVRAVILTGAGERAFSAGADIYEFAQSVAEGPEVAVRDFVRRGQRMTARIESFGKPVIAAINGLAYGGGCEIVEATHLAVASADAMFAKPEIRLGMPPTFGGTQRLPRLAGRKRALEHLLTGEPFPAERALSIGLINSIVPQDHVVVAAEDLARRTLRHHSTAIRSILTSVTRGLNLTIDEGLQCEAEQFGRAAATDEMRVALEAWCSRSRSGLDGP